MGIYQRVVKLLPKQSCVLCLESAEFCVCKKCESGLIDTSNRCLSCATKLSSGLSFCGSCLSHAPNFSRAYTLYDYSDSCAQLIKKFKFDHQLCIGDYFAHQLFDLYTSIIGEKGDYNAIIPLPLSSKRLKERGYNQTHELLRIIAKNTDVLIDISSVKRIKATKPLSSLNLEERKVEIKGAFSAQPMNYSNVLLVDDIMTTGSSLNELAKIVLKAGVGSCDVLTLARA